MFTLWARRMILVNDFTRFLIIFFEKFVKKIISFFRYIFFSAESCIRLYTVLKKYDCTENFQSDLSAIFHKILNYIWFKTVTDNKEYSFGPLRLQRLFYLDLIYLLYILIF
jgi:hypothetical protein